MNPFLITGPAQIAFSGGRTSGYLLKRVLDAHGGALPDDVLVVFTNTGKEREETLRFVHECSLRWGFPIHWVEWRLGGQFERVTFETASRDGEPFEALIQSRQYLPNGRERICTQELKVLTAARYLQSLGWDEWDSVLGVRADEPERLAKLRDADAGACWTNLFPLAAAGVTKADVQAFWCRQPFQLELQPGDGNCDLCFLRDQAHRVRVLMREPQRGEWWARMESERGATFRNRNRPAYAELIQIANLHRDTPVEACAPSGVDGLKRKGRVLERQPLLFIADGPPTDDLSRCSYCGD